MPGVGSNIIMETLYRKYRPQRFADVQGQEHVVQTLRGALISANPGHAYLFTGPRGTGKTTMARLFAKALNCTKRDKKSGEPCNECSDCQEIASGVSLDLIEIDAASNRGIDEIRSLKDSALVSTHHTNNKVFIVDEVHMLTTPAFNALLKTLEEPPRNVIFILATTEPHKVPETILSRVQRFDFKKITSDRVVEKLKIIVASEKIKIEDEVFPIIATVAGGSLRDAESIMTKLVNYHGSKAITGESAQKILGIVPMTIHRDLWQQLRNKNLDASLGTITSLVEAGFSIDQFSQQFLHFLRDQLIHDAKGDIQPLLIETIKLFTNARLEMRHSPIPQLPFELAIIELNKI